MIYLIFIFPFIKFSKRPFISRNNSTCTTIIVFSLGSMVGLPMNFRFMRIQPHGDTMWRGAMPSFAAAKLASASCPTTKNVCSESLFFFCFGEIQDIVRDSLSIFLVSVICWLMFWWDIRCCVLNQGVKGKVVECFYHYTYELDSWGPPNSQMDGLRPDCLDATK